LDDHRLYGQSLVRALDKATMSDLIARVQAVCPAGKNWEDVAKQAARKMLRLCKDKTVTRLEIHRIDAPPMIEKDHVSFHEGSRALAEAIVEKGLDDAVKADPYQKKDTLRRAWANQIGQSQQPKGERLQVTA
jgi:hypothetical protein